MKILKTRWSVCFGFLALCLSLLVSLLMPVMFVRAEALQTYQFIFNDGYYDFESTYTGNDIDFVSGFLVFYGNEANYYGQHDYTISPFILSLSFEPFTYYTYMDGKPYVSDGRSISINYTPKNGENSVNVYYAISTFGISGSTKRTKIELLDESFNFSGFPNLRTYRDDFVSQKSLSDYRDNTFFYEIIEEFVANGGIDWEPKDLDEDGVLDLEMEIPRLWVDYNGDGGYDFIFENAAYDTYFELQGRWYTVDDIILSRKSWSLEQWKYSYQSIIKTPLSSWVDVNDKMSSIGTYDLAELGSSAFNQMLLDYPISNRSYTGGTNALGNYLFGYNDALNQLQDFLLPTPESLFNGAEVYVRFWCYDEDGMLHYSKWTHWYDSLADAGGSSGSRWDDLDNMYTENQSQSGLTDSEKDQLEDSGYSRNDPDAQTSNTYNPDDFSQAVSNFGEILFSTSNFLGDFPALVNTVFGFLPSWLMIFIALGIAVIIILRIVGR